MYKAGSLADAKKIPVANHVPKSLDDNDLIMGANDQGIYEEGLALNE